MAQKSVCQTADPLFIALPLQLPQLAVFQINPVTIESNISH